VKDIKRLERTVATLQAQAAPSPEPTPQEARRWKRLVAALYRLAPEHAEEVLRAAGVSP
jgi:hypothetical protein